jgi:hypothetical protein
MSALTYHMWARLQDGRVRAYLTQATCRFSDDRGYAGLTPRGAAAGYLHDG